MVVICTKKLKDMSNYILIKQNGAKSYSVDKTGETQILPTFLHTVNVDCVKFEYVVLAKYHHMLIFEFDLLTKQHILILCKKLL